MFGRSIKQGIEGSMKGKMLMKADLVQPKPDLFFSFSKAQLNSE